MTRAAILLGLLAISCVGVSGKSAMPAPSDPPAKKEWLVLLPVALKPELTDSEAGKLPLFARGSVLAAFEERNILGVSPVQMQVTEREMNLKLADSGGWTVELFKKLATRWKARYVATVTVASLESKEGPVQGVPPSPPPPGAQLTTVVKVVASLYDAKTGKFILENKELEISNRVGRPGPSNEQVESERLRAVSEASKQVFKDWLKKQPMKPPSRGVNAGGGQGQ